MVSKSGGPGLRRRRIFWARPSQAVPLVSQGRFRVLRSIPLLDAAAVEAVKQWEYALTLLNGVPVPVIMTVTVNFTLQ